jgi:hypothetical protein
MYYFIEELLERHRVVCSLEKDHQTVRQKVIWRIKTNEQPDVLFLVMRQGVAMHLGQGLLNQFSSHQYCTSVDQFMESRQFLLQHFVTTEVKM